MLSAIGYAAKSARSPLEAFEFQRKSLGPHEILIDIQYCGVCHSDVHQARNEWHNTLYPCLPGHEIIGVVSKTGSDVTKHKVGDLVGVGCLIDSCHNCDPCRQGLEQMCEKGATATYNGNIREPDQNKNTYGGYSDKIVVKENFVLSIPKKIPPEAAGPILCAGITTYSPLRQWKVGPGTRVGVVGVGGLGHMAIKLAKAMGAEVTAITHSKAKVTDSKAIGANHVLLSTDSSAMKKAESSLDFILSTIPKSHDVNPYLELLAPDGVMCIVGCLDPLEKPIDMTKMVMDRRTLATSIIGGIRETQEVLDFCAKHEIWPDTRLIDIKEVNDAFDHLDKGDVDYRYVIDISSLRGQHESVGLLEAIGIEPESKRKPH